MKAFTDEQKSLLRKVKKFAVDDEAQSTKEVIVSVVPFLLFIFLAGWTESLLVGVASSVISGFLLLRMFCLYHDFMHGAILRKKKWADVLFTVFSVLLLTPKNVWRETHNYHHTNNMRRGATHIGSFKLVTIEDWAAMSPADRKAYKATRHPLTVLLGTITMFIVGMIIMPVLRNAKKNYDGIILLVAYLAMMAAVTMLLGFGVFLLSVFIPQAIAGGIGAYIFYAQHNFPTSTLHTKAEWNHASAAMDSTVFIKMSPLMCWMTCNIGYHHIHHLNHQVPFYRLPAAMAEIPELAPKHVTSFSFKDAKDNFSLKLWDDSENTFVNNYPE